MIAVKTQLVVLGVFHIITGIVAGLTIPVVISIYAKDAARIPTTEHPYASVAMLNSFLPILKVWVASLCFYCVGNLFSGLYLLVRRRRRFSFYMAVMNLLLAPLGSIVAILTIVTLRRPATREAYEA